MAMGLIPINDPSQKALQGMAQGSTSMARQDRVIKPAEEEKSAAGALSAVGTGAAMGAAVGNAPGAIIGGAVSLLGYFLF